MQRNTLLINVGKLVSQISKSLNIGNGSTWPGHIALKCNKHVIQDMLRASSVDVILVAGTNGKTTTSLLLKTILEKNGRKVIHNASGANLLNGLASLLLLNTNDKGKIEASVVIFEVDENTLPLVLKQTDPSFVILLNLFRDQLDRYGEVANIARKWANALENKKEIRLVLNADDPEIAYIGQKLNDKQTVYFGLDHGRKKEIEHASDSIYCPRCNHMLAYKSLSYSHLGNWLCPHCGLIRPELNMNKVAYTPLLGLYNQYNTLAALLTACELGITEENAEKALRDFKPAFGRGEKIEYDGKYVQIILAKNPAGFNEALRTIKEIDENKKEVVLALNDNIADGTDVSWIWDVDIEMLHEYAKNVIITGRRAYDMGIRIKYGGYDKSEYVIQEDTRLAIHAALNRLGGNETLYVLPTYTAMLEMRNILTGKKIL